ncbi:hypothetical protein PsorP6_015150 [Peronosclerospora sorghi]|uniref:Uncharacterized protein n=1 Tax=Peronosclerospora sorghi TaxID=230839 RepID=A0ACC0VUN2_9STRA|nr:hypothetical protein PsorP6_015150 [Peronosclerospora sorghi]
MKATGGPPTTFQSSVCPLVDVSKKLSWQSVKEDYFIMCGKESKIMFIGIIFQYCHQDILATRDQILSPTTCIEHSLIVEEQLKTTQRLRWDKAPTNIVGLIGSSEVSRADLRCS